MGKRKTRTARGIVLILLVVCLFSMTACGKKQTDSSETNTTTENKVPNETETHTHKFVNGLCACGDSNGFEGITVFTDSGLKAVQRQDAEMAMTLISANGASKSEQISLKKEIKVAYGKYYEMVYCFTSNVAGKVRFACENATVYDEGTFDVVSGENKIVVRFAADKKADGKVATGLELGGLANFELKFTNISVKEISKPSEEVETPPVDETPTNLFSSFNVWWESSVNAVVRKDTTNNMTLTSQNASVDWWKIKVEKDLMCSEGKCYEVTYTFTSDATGRIKFVNDDAFYYGSNEYDVVKGENTFTVRFKYNGKPYSCLELGGLSPFKLVFTNYVIKEIAEPEIVSNGFESYQGWTESSMKPLKREDTADSMILISDNVSGDWWKVKLENNFKLQAGKTYEAVYIFNSDAEGDIKFGTNEKVTCVTNDVYHATKGENRFAVTFTAEDGAYTCLELGGLGKFKLTFTGITLKEVEKPVEPERPEQPEQPEQPGQHTHSFVKGKCECGADNGFTGVSVWTEGALTPITREDTENSMIVTSTNEYADWWKVKVEWPLTITEGKTYEATFTFTSDVSGTIKYNVNAATFLDSQEYNVVVGDNSFKVCFTAGAENYSCLELGGLGKFKLTFTGIALKEVEKPAEPEQPEQPEQPGEHTHSFENGKCECGADNGFAGVSVWTEGALTPVVREDTENSMIMTSTNDSADWWKVKVEWPLNVTEGKTYEATFTFTSDVAGTIKYSVNAATFLDSQEYNVVVGDNSFKVHFTAGAENYSCLELGGLGKFKLTFTGIELKEVEKPAEPEQPEQPEQPGEHTHSFENGKCECGADNGFAGVSVWTEGALTPVVREDTENSMIMTSTNDSADWWKVKVEWPLNVTEGKTYEATFTFTSDVAGTIKYSVNAATFLDSQEYNVVVGDNSFKVHFTAGAENYSCLELGGLGKFKLTFTDIALKEV